MASSPSTSSSSSGSGSVGNLDSALEIKTRSVEQTLIPLVSQITTLINHKDKPKKTERTLRAIQKVGQAVSIAVGRFVTVGEAIAVENEELKEEMGLACFEARRAQEIYPSLLFLHRLLTSWIHLILLALTSFLPCYIRLVSGHGVNALQVLVTLDQLETVSSFQEFVQIFSHFGNEMVEFAHLTGDRQNDLKDEKKKARMAAARAVLEKCTMMLLTASKTCLRHPDCESARINKDAVFHRMRFALEQVIEIVTDARPGGDAQVLPVNIYSGIKHFKGKVESLRDELYALTPETLHSHLEGIGEQTQDFTDSAYTSHEHRESILQLCHAARQELQQVVCDWTYAQSLKAKEATEEMELSILKTCQTVSELRRELHKAAVGRATDLLKCHKDHIVLKALKGSGGEGNLEAVAEYSHKLTEQKEQLVETCRLLRHISGTEPLEITCIHAEETFQIIGPQIISAAQTLALHPSSKIAKENLDVFCEAWESQLNDMAILLREINDVFEGRRGDKKMYLSLPRPGKHSANLKMAKAAKLDAEEQTTIAKLGLELRLLTSDVDSESEKWEDREHEIVRQGQSLSSMAYSMYLFTRGEGLLKTTLDLFHQAELEEEEHTVILLETEKLVALCQQLQVTARTAVQGKTAMFQKVDSSIQNTKRHLCYPSFWKDKQCPVKEDSLNSKNTNGFGVRALEHHMGSLTFLESK
uniref:Alpha-catulin n=1 Tax=Scleropages formosus TaxID=113540 RepID=A0A8C9WIF0_SCLFO